MRDGRWMEGVNRYRVRRVRENSIDNPCPYSGSYRGSSRLEKNHHDSAVVSRRFFCLE